MFHGPLPGPLPGPTNLALQPAMSAMTPLRLALAQSTVDPTLISAWACLEIYIRAPYPPPSDDYGLHRGGLQEIKSSCPCLSMSVTASPHCPPPPLLPLRLKSWHPLSSLSLASSLAEAVLPDRALYLPTFGHFLIVNKTSLSLSPSLFLSLPLMPWHPLSIYDARRRNCPIH